MRNEYACSGQMDIFQLFDTGFGMTTDEKIVKYLFDTKEVCEVYGWFSDVKKYIWPEVTFWMLSRMFFPIVSEATGPMLSSGTIQI